MSDCQGANEYGVNIDLYNNGFIKPFLVAWGNKYNNKIWYSITSES